MHSNLPRNPLRRSSETTQEPSVPPGTAFLRPRRAATRDTLFLLWTPSGLRDPDDFLAARAATRVHLQQVCPAVFENPAPCERPGSAGGLGPGRLGKTAIRQPAGQVASPALSLFSN